MSKPFVLSSLRTVIPLSAAYFASLFTVSPVNILYSQSLMPVINSVTVDYNGRTDLFNTFIESLLIDFLNESGADSYDAAAETELAISA